MKYVRQFKINNCTTSKADPDSHCGPGHSTGVKVKVIAITK
jgi:hypothetical protein